MILQEHYRMILSCYCVCRCFQVLLSVLFESTSALTITFIFHRLTDWFVPLPISLLIYPFDLAFSSSSPSTYYWWTYRAHIVLVAAYFSVLCWAVDHCCSKNLIFAKEWLCVLQVWPVPGWAAATGLSSTTVCAGTTTSTTSSGCWRRSSTLSSMRTYLSSVRVSVHPGTRPGLRCSSRLDSLSLISILIS